jgi:hypothetical protein
MNRSLTALFAAFEAALVVAIGIGISLAPLTVLWGAQFGFQIDWVVFWRASVDIWLLGHGVDTIVALDPTVAAGLGLAGADAAFKLTIAALGFAVLTAVLGVRAGRRVAETRFLLLGELVAIATFGALTVLVTLSALHPLARPSIVQGALQPTLVFAIAVVVGSLRSRRPSTDAAIQPIRDRLRSLARRIPSGVRVTAAHAVRGGLAAVVAVIGVAAIVLGVLVALDYAQVVRLYEGLHTEVLGGIALTLAQLAFIPTFVIWVASWLIGPGFAIGVGSSVSPIATTLGPIPAIPIFGALPQSAPAFGLVGVLAPVIAAFLAAALLRPGLVRALGGGILPKKYAAAAGLATGVVGGLVLGLLALAASGAAGPGRLAQVGPDPLAVGLWAALEIGLAATAGYLAARPAALSQEADPGTAASMNQMAAPESSEPDSEPSIVPDESLPDGSAAAPR